jgi:hypothetical protein
MSEFQYYEFQALDQPLDQAAQQALRSMSSRATITARSFTNHYEWGDFKGDSRKLVERWFDVHVYLTNWGTRRLMMRLPKRFLDRTDLAPFVGSVDWVETWTSGDNLVIDIYRGELELGEDDWNDDGSGWLATLAPLRAELLSGDLRLFYLAWLAAVQDELLPDHAHEPLPGIAPLTPALEAFADFFQIDGDLVHAAAESGGRDTELSMDKRRDAVAAIPEQEKTELLFRVLNGDNYVGAELRSRVRNQSPRPSIKGRTVGELRARAREFADERERAAEQQRQAEERLQAEVAEKARRTRLDTLKRRGETVWREIENEIERRNPGGYDRALGLLTDLAVLATEQGSNRDFNRRLQAIRERHAKKGRFIERLAALKCASGD